MHGVITQKSTAVHDVINPEVYSNARDVTQKTSVSATQHMPTWKGILVGQPVKVSHIDAIYVTRLLNNECQMS
jgi:hypothetical protein